MLEGPYRHLLQRTCHNTTCLHSVIGYGLEYHDSDISWSWNLINECQVQRLANVLEGAL